MRRYHNALRVGEPTLFNLESRPHRIDTLDAARAKELARGFFNVARRLAGARPSRGGGVPGRGARLRTAEGDRDRQRDCDRHLTAVRSDFYSGCHDLLARRLIGSGMIDLARASARLLAGVRIGRALTPAVPRSIFKVLADS